jgi:hypothetical protein
MNDPAPPDPADTPESPDPADPADPAPDPEEPGNAPRARKRQSLGQSIGGVLFGFEQQVWRNVPPPHELVHHARPDDPVPAGDGGFMTLEMPAPLAPAGPAAGDDSGRPEPAPGDLEPAGPDTVLASGDEHGSRRHRPPTPPRGLPDGPAPAPGVRGER